MVSESNKKRSGIACMDEADSWWLTLSVMEKQSVIGASFAIEKKMTEDEVKDGDIFGFLDKAVKWFEGLTHSEQRARVAYAYCEAKEINPLDEVDWNG